MSDDFVTRLQYQLREAAERDARRGSVARAAAAARWRVLSPPVLVGAVTACALAIVVAVTLTALRHTSPPVEQAVPPDHRLTVEDRGPLVTQGGAIAPGFGAIWAIDAGSGELLRIDPRNERVLARVSVGDQAFPTTGAGAVWTAADGRLLKIDPASNRVTARIPLGLGARTFVIVYARAGVVWVPTPQELLRIDPRRDVIDRRIPLEHASFQASGFAADQQLLYIMRADGVLLLRDAATGAPVATTRLDSAGFLMGAANGTVVIATATPNDIAAMDARSGRRLWRADLGADRVNDGIVADGSIWIHATNSDTGRDQLIRLDAGDGHRIGSVALPVFGVASMAAVDDGVWIVSPSGRLMVVR
jgi:sugar lactone lactonase YvrE